MDSKTEQDFHDLSQDNYIKVWPQGMMLGEKFVDIDAVLTTSQVGIVYRYMLELDARQNRKGAKIMTPSIDLIHNNCGGHIEEDWSKVYTYNTGGSGEEHDTIVPGYRCRKCGKEILGDSSCTIIGIEGV